MSTITAVSPIVKTETSSTDIALQVIRLAIAVPFIFHGAQILFGAFGGPGLKGFAAMGHMPLPMATLVGSGEFFGGLGVLFGVLSRLAGAGILIIMLGAILLVHIHNGYSVMNNGVEYPLTQVFLTLAVLIAGPGKLTAWSAIGQSGPNRPILK